MIAVELGRHLDRQPQFAPGRLHLQGVRNGADEVAAQADEAADAAVEDALAGLYRIHAIFARRLETELPTQVVHRHLRCLFGDADGALTLHVGVAAHRQDARALLAHVAAQQEQVDQHLDGLHAVAVLGQAHTIGGDHPLAAGIGGGRRFHRCAGEAGATLQLLPGVAANACFEGLEAMGVLLDEGDIEHPLAPFGDGQVVHGEQRLAHPGDGRHVAADGQLVILGADHRAVRRQHLARRLRVDETLQATLTQRVEGDDLGPALARGLQFMEHARAGGTGILAEEEQSVGVLEVVQGDRCHRYANAFGQGHRGALVAHVGTVRQVVGAVQARQQAIHVGRLQRRTPGHVEHHLVGIVHGLEFGADLGEGAVPADRLIMVAGCIVAQRMGQPALLFQVEVAPVEQLADAVPGEEFRAATQRGVFPCRGLGAVLAERQRPRGVRLGPGAADAGEAVDGFVLLEQQADAGRRDAFTQQDVGDGVGRSPATGRCTVGFELGLGHVVPPFARELVCLRRGPRRIVQGALSQGCATHSMAKPC